MKNATQYGRKSLNRILGGVVTQENEFPWQCALLNKDESFWRCAPKLLSSDHCYGSSLLCGVSYKGSKYDESFPN